jgi:hypothetical protein
MMTDQELALSGRCDVCWLPVQGWRINPRVVPRHRGDRGQGCIQALKAEVDRLQELIDTQPTEAELAEIEAGPHHCLEIGLLANVLKEDLKLQAEAEIQAKWCETLQNVMAGDGALCAYCFERVTGPDHWRACPKHPARAEVERLQRGLAWHHCDTHGDVDPVAWGCPECLRELRTDVTRLRSVLGAERSGTLGGNGSHWSDCWRVHIDCAALEIERLQAENASLHERRQNAAGQVNPIDTIVALECELHDEGRANERLRRQQAAIKQRVQAMIFRLRSEGRLTNDDYAAAVTLLSEQQASILDTESSLYAIHAGGQLLREGGPA